MLQGIATARPPSPSIASATSSQASDLRLEMITCAPCAAIASAMARPMPLAVPGINAVLPSRRKRSAYFMAGTGRALCGGDRASIVCPPSLGQPHGSRGAPPIQGNARMNLDLSPELREFRDEVRAFIRAELPADIK